MVVISFFFFFRLIFIGKWVQHSRSSTRSRSYESGGYISGDPTHLDPIQCIYCNTYGLSGCSCQFQVSLPVVVPIILSPASYFGWRPVYSRPHTSAIIYGGRFLKFFTSFLLVLKIFQS